MKSLLTAPLAAIFAVIVWITARSSLAVSLWDAWPGYAAYCGFLTFFCWVVCREPSWLHRALWFVTGGPVYAVLRRREA